MDLVFHDRMSEFLKSVPLSPPRREGNGFDLLDVVVIDPHAKDPAKMIIPTDTNLTKHFTKEKVHRRHMSSNSYPIDEQRTSDELFQLNDELMASIGVDGVNASTHGKHSSSAHVNLVISNEKTKSVSGAVIPRLERMVKDCFRGIIRNAFRFNIKTNEHWYNYYTGSHDVYYIAVITRTNHGTLSVEESGSKGFAAGVSAKVKGVFESLTESSRSESSSLVASSEGIVGVQMLCFPFKKTDVVGTYDVQDPTTIRRLDQRERKHLQNAHKRRNWTLVEGKNEDQMYFNRSRRRLSELMSRVGHTVENTVTHVKQHVKSHDFSRLKSIATVFATLMVAAVLLIPILSSLCANTAVFHADFDQLSARQVYMIQQAFNEGFCDFMSFALSAVLHR